MCVALLGWAGLGLALFRFVLSLFSCVFFFFNSGLFTCSLVILFILYYRFVRLLVVCEHFYHDVKARLRGWSVLTQQIPVNSREPVADHHVSPVASHALVSAPESVSCMRSSVPSSQILALSCSFNVIFIFTVTIKIFS